MILSEIKKQAELIYGSTLHASFNLIDGRNMLSLETIKDGETRAVDIHVTPNDQAMDDEDFLKIVLRPALESFANWMKN